MKTIIKTITAALSFLLIFSCTKQNVSKPSASANASSSANSTTAFHIGQSFGGGIIFYIDNTGQHGLIAAINDQGTGISWNKNGKNINTGAKATAVGTGNANTTKIVNAQSKTGTYAALLCFKYKHNGFTDWYLPSKDELNLLYQQRNVVGGLGATNYWSSSEVSRGKAWDQEFGGGFQFKDTKSFTLNVRAVSSF